MYQLNVPAKYTVTSRLWLNVALIVLAVIFAFTPIISLDMSDADLWDDVQVAIDSMAEEFPEFKDIERPEDKVDISIGKVYSSVGVIGKVLTAVMEGAQEEGDTGKMEAELEQIITSKEGQETIIMTFAIATQLMDFESLTEENANMTDNVGMIIETVLKFIIILYLMAFIAIWPIVLLIVGIVNVVRALKNIKTPELAIGKVGSVLGKYFATALAIAFVLTMLPGFEWGSGLTAIFVCSIISIVASIAATRLRAYRPGDFMCANVVQGAAVLQGVGFAVFFTNLVKSNIVFDFFKALGEYIMGAIKQIDQINVIVDANNELYYQNITDRYILRAELDGAFAIDLALVVVFFIIALSAVTAVSGAVIDRLTLASAKPKTSTMFSASILAIIASIIPMAITKLENRMVWSWEDMSKSWEVNTDGAIFTMNADNEAAVNGMLVGGVIMLVTAIVYVIVKRILCPKVTKEDTIALLSGNAPVVEPAAAVAEEAPVEEAPVDEAPAEEVPAEEAPVEEAPAEEVPAEEAPVENSAE